MTDMIQHIGVVMTGRDTVIAYCKAELDVADQQSYTIISSTYGPNTCEDCKAAHALRLLGNVP